MVGNQQTHSLLGGFPHMGTELGLWNSEIAPALYLKPGILESEDCGSWREFILPKGL